MINEKNAVLVTGATGYIGGRLVPRLLEREHPVRMLTRDVARVASRSWSSRVEVEKKYNIVRHGGTLYAMGEYHRMVPGAQMRATMEKSANDRVTEIRIDYVQHALCALIQYKRRFF